MIENLKHNNFLATDNFIEKNELQLLLKEFDELYKGGHFRKAGVGKKTNNLDAKAVIRPDIRTDEIFWVDFNTPTVAQEIIKPKLDKIIKTVNQKLFLGIRNFEGHFAYYNKGSFYKRHLDTFLNDDARVLSFVLYLNENWQKGDGGELCIYDNQKEKIIIEPIGGRLILFLSQLLEHEVLQSHKPRKSFTGWFKK